MIWWSHDVMSMLQQVATSTSHHMNIISPTCWCDMMILMCDVDIHMAKAIWTSTSHTNITTSHQQCTMIVLQLGSLLFGQRPNNGAHSWQHYHWLARVHILVHTCVHKYAPTYTPTCVYRSLFAHMIASNLWLLSYHGSKLVIWARQGRWQVEVIDSRS